MPTEIVWKVLTLLDPYDVSNTRLTCKRLRTYCDHPSIWKDISLNPQCLTKVHTASGALTLWNLLELKEIIQPHLSLIKTIKILGVRDNIIRYLILHCNKLENLTISGWSTLSDHALRVPFQPDQQLCLRRLRLVGRQKSNFTSLDATTFGKLIAKCPYLEELSVVSCQIHIQADSFLKSFDFIHRLPEGNLLSLKSLTMATKRTWSSQHITKLFQLCSSLCVLALVPDSDNIPEIADELPPQAASLVPIVKSHEPILEKSVQF
ncbi:hypothetical protein INT47_007371 [Mucor saturninus]|uniref:F-box domain-containing protein n=1 Tax=Mucor saturninus TaxID=64648 RepID=A0A8H7QXM1_9FUNG|nr:hypothetical protein INT47_007371 [Mucor saturninus]